MSITQTLTNSFKVQLLQGVHNFGTTITPYDGDSFYMALYSSTADLGPTTTVYTATGEITGTGYTAGGILLSVSNPPSIVYSGTTQLNVALTSFFNAVWSGATFSTVGALIYNASKGNKSVAVLNFGSTKLAVGGAFTVQFPAVSATSAIIRIA